MQETMLRAWRGLGRFELRSSPRVVLGTIATNVCLRAIVRRPKLVLPADYGPPAAGKGDLAAPVVESVWIHPAPARGHPGRASRALAWIVLAAAVYH